MNIAFSSLRELGDALRKNDCTSVEITRIFLDRINLSKQLHAFVDTHKEAALEDAQASDARRRAGLTNSAVDGLPIALKDSCEIAGRIATNGSMSRARCISVQTASVVRRLRDAGAVILGSTHMVEFAYGGWGTNPLMGAPQNPWCVSQHMVPGGSSSGSAVAVAAGLSPVAIGTDTGGSIRNPAAFCGITGLKTTVGLLAADGVLPLAPTFDSIGPLARDAADAALMCEILSGRRMSVHHERNNADLAGVRVATFPEADFPSVLDGEVLVAYDRAIDVLRSCGAVVAEVPLPFSHDALVQNNGRIISAEAWAIHRSVVEDDTQPVGDAVRARIRLGAGISRQEYLEALSHHRNARLLWSNFMSNFDAMIMPTMPVFACPIEEVDETAAHTAYFNRVANHVGGCALTIPAGFSESGMPIGVQLVGKAFDEESILRIGIAFQAQTVWHKNQPDLGGLTAQEGREPF